MFKVWGNFGAFYNLDKNLTSNLSKFIDLRHLILIAVSHVIGNFNLVTNQDLRMPLIMIVKRINNVDDICRVFVAINGTLFR